MKKILISALLMAGVAFGADAVTYAYDVASNYTGTYALSSPANYKNGNTSISSNYNKSGYYIGLYENEKIESCNNRNGNDSK